MWNAIVVFPDPGSPATTTRDWLNSPPPRIRSNIERPVLTRCMALVSNNSSRGKNRAVCTTTPPHANHSTGLSTIVTTLFRFTHTPFTIEEPGNARIRGLVLPSTALQPGDRSMRPCSIWLNSPKAHAGQDMAHLVTHPKRQRPRLPSLSSLRPRGPSSSSSSS